jgi:hypothetical protein
MDIRQLLGFGIPRPDSVGAAEIRDARLGGEPAPVSATMFDERATQPLIASRSGMDSVETVAAIS